MPQNIYDNDDFFADYSHLRDTQSGLNEVLEQPALKSLLPPLDGRDVLELGCGMGQFAAWCAAQKAASVLGVDISAKMLERARRENAHPAITYRQEPLETLTLPAESYDLVVSSLALHYLEDYAGLVRRVQEWLRPGGVFVYSVEHPIATARNPMGAWQKNERGEKIGWLVDDYGDEGPREHDWFVAGVVKYHRKLETLINELISAGLMVERLSEPEALPSAVALRPSLAEQRRLPPFLLVRSRRPQDGV